MAQASYRPSDIVASPSEALKDPRSSTHLPDDEVIDNMGKLSLADDHAVYIGSSHWITILEDIQRLKDDLSDQDTESTTSQVRTSLDEGLMNKPPATRISLLASATCHSREQILAMVPPRKVVDRHVSHFFNTFDFATLILHRSKFLEEYAGFWKDPSAAPIMWIGLLFSVMSMSAFLQQQDIGSFGLSAVESQNMLETYRTLTIHCLVAGDYLRPGKHTIETLTLHFALDQNATLDTSIGNWALIGVVVRIALRMGLHRDPSHWPNIRPLQAELRRRIWITLYHMDFFTSTQVGLPRIIKDSQCDTRPPIHLFDDDLSFENNEIPPARPLTESTPLLHIIQRDTIIKVAAEIYDATEAGPPSSATIDALDAKLQAAVDAIPPHFKYRSLETSLAENPVMILHRMILDILINKAVYLLHRRSFVRGSVGEANTESNDRCITAALAILEHQRRMSEETEPGGLMFGIRWKVASSLNHEFLQAAMMLCFALTRTKDANVGTSSVGALHGRNNTFEALTIAKRLWEKNADRSTEAQRAVKALSAALGQDLRKISTPDLTTSDGLGQMPGLVTESYLGSFDYEQDITVESCFFPVSDDAEVFGSFLEDFVTIDMVQNEGTEST
ncbi:hypothetical protein QQX98_003133 [Neonectria punicea]|uniref:Xylanolytic transcriptional activator regulatory domain-containing protein n=1 Tax=Neonectria punicea TaxID=979145 RepID=A0ABR1HGS1_9HYPO